MRSSVVTYFRFLVCAVAQISRFGRCFPTLVRYRWVSGSSPRRMPCTSAETLGLEVGVLPPFSRPGLGSSSLPYIDSSGSDSLFRVGASGRFRDAEN